VASAADVSASRSSASAVVGFWPSLEDGKQRLSPVIVNLDRSARADVIERAVELPQMLDELLPLSVSLSASDAGSSVKATYYTLDGSDPSSSSNLNRVSYNSPFTVSATTTVRFSSLDNAGNVEAAKSQTITITTAAVAAALVR
jgi:hypothetical protein